MKKISGGDMITGRNHREGETDFKPQFLAILFANDIPKISGIDEDNAINDRLKVISYTKKYVDEPTNEFELLKDHNINNEMESEKFKEAFNFIIFDAYKKYMKNKDLDIEPEQVKFIKTEWVGDGGSNKTISTFLESFEITDKPEDYVLSAYIELWLKDNNMNITIKKFAMELKKYCSIHKYGNVESKGKKLNKKNKQV